LFFPRLESLSHFCRHSGDGAEGKITNRALHAEGEAIVEDMELIAVAAGVLLLIGFVGGYGVRALISWHRRARVERQHFERLADEVNARPKTRLAIGSKSGDRGDFFKNGERP